MIEPEINKLASMIDLERDHQKSAVLWALTRFLEAKQCGVVLADEVGCGKTYEALAVTALLWYHYCSHDAEKPIRRVLILCKSSLLRKWYEELTAQPEETDKESRGCRICSKESKQGIRAYLTEKCWNDFNEKFINSMYFIENLNHAKNLWSRKILRGTNEGGRRQVPEGLYLVNQHLLYDSTREKSELLRNLYRTDWDLIIVDEAHHYGKGNKCDRIFVDLNYRHIMLLTATPFELDPSEMLNLLRIAEASERDLEQLGSTLKQYQQVLNRFYEIRMLPPNNERRIEIVKRLHQLRLGINPFNGSEKPMVSHSWLKSFCPRPQNQGDGLEGIMRRYIVRNLKETKRMIPRIDDRSVEESVRRDYSLVNREDNKWMKCHFDKFDDLKATCSKEPLIPFAGSDALFYLHLRELIQELIEHRDNIDKHGVFVAMDLQQGLSSYPQLLAHSEDERPRLLDHDSEQAKDLRNLLYEWDKKGKLHPKVVALVETVKAIVEHEINQVDKDPTKWFGKIVIFNKLVKGTAPHLRKHLIKAIEPMLQDMLIRMSQNTIFNDADDLRQTAREIIKDEMSNACDWATNRCRERGEVSELKASILRDAGFKRQNDEHPVKVLFHYFEGRAVQDLFLIDFLRNCREYEKEANEQLLRRFICENLIAPAVRRLDRIVDNYFDSNPNADELKRLGKAALYELGIRHLSLLREELRLTKIVARYDGEVKDDRESNRINFNNRWNPFALIVSRVGEEGIDLQIHTKYVLHYDLEWNPAKMEQREGRIDREGYGHEGEPIDVRFFLLKSTYEERIFHTVMRRDQWFQILMGAQRKHLGQIVEDDKDSIKEEDETFQEAKIESEMGNGSLTQDEKKAVMLDLRPPSADVYELPVC